MQEAFRQAMEKNPDSPIVPVIKDVNRAQATEAFKQRQETRSAQLRKQFYNLGQMWYDTQADILFGSRHIPIKQRRREWLQGLTTLQDKPSEQRIELLSAMASGMQLTGDHRDHAPRVYAQSILQRVFDNPLDLLRDKLLGVNLTPQSILFMEAISDMSSHSKEQKQEFRDFMVKKSGLTGRVEMSQLFPVISRWIDHDAPPASNVREQHKT